MNLQGIFSSSMTKFSPLGGEWSLENAFQLASSWIQPSAALVAVGAFAGSIVVLFPLQVKYQAPEARLAEIYATLWDVARNAIQGDAPAYQSISTQDLVERLKTDNNKQILVVDTRTYQDYRNGHIEGSVFLPFNEFRAEYHALPKNNNNKTIVILCQFGHYSVVACNILLQAGYPKVLDYAAGMEEWTNLDLPVAKGMVDSDLVVVQKPNSVVTTTTTTGRSVSNDPNRPEVLFPRTKNRMVYLDYNATTPLDPRVLDKMMPFLTHEFGNAASRTGYGARAEVAVHHARVQVAQILLAANEDEIVFTSGASESNNLAIKGIAHQMRKMDPNKSHIITCVTEHKAVLDTCQHLQAHEGFEVTYLGVDTHGRIRLSELQNVIRPGQTCLVSIMLANNEIGTIQPFQEIGKICRSNNVLFHTDGTQGVGKLEVNVQEDCVDLMSISGHKIYGPKGVGALYIRSGIQLMEQINGGGHEGGKRSGTLNVPGIVGLGHACELADQVRVEENERILGLRTLLQARLSEGIPKSYVNGSMEDRLVGNLHMSFEGVTSEEVLMELGSEVAISSGSACNSRKTGPSHVLVALNLPKERMSCTLRFGVGRFTNRDDIDFVANRMIEIVTKKRAAVGIK